MPFYPVKWGTFFPGEMSVIVWLPNTFIYISQTTTYFFSFLSVFCYFTWIATCPQIRKSPGKCHLSENHSFKWVLGFCIFGQHVATWDWLVRSSYPQLLGMVNLIQIQQVGSENVLLSWRTFPLTYLHSPVHLCNSC